MERHKYSPLAGAEVLGRAVVMGTAMAAVKGSALAAVSAREPATETVTGTALATQPPSGSPKRAPCLLFATSARNSELPAQPRAQVLAAGTQR